MNSIRRRCVPLLLIAAGLVPLAQAHAAAGCSVAASAPLTIGTVAAVAPGGAQTFSINLGAHDGVIVDLVSTSSTPTPAASSDDHSSSSSDAAVVRDIKICNAAGALLAPQPGEVFAKGGSVAAIDDGQRLRFQADAAGSYRITVAPSNVAREILVRRRDVGTGPAPTVSAVLGTPQKGIASSSAPMVFSFDAPAGQWVKLKSTSEKDTLLRLAGPDREGNYSVIAENDDSDGLNPVIRRKLTLAGTYYVQVDSLAEEPGEFNLTLEKTDAPKPPPPPLPLRSGAVTTGKLADGDAVAIYALPVAAGHSYRIDLTTVYDGVVAIGLTSPVEPDDGNSGPDAGYTEIKSQDANTSGTEKLNFTARNSGQLLVRVKSFGIGDTDGAYTLTVNDLGG